MMDSKPPELAPLMIRSHTGLRGIAACSVFMGHLYELEILEWGLNSKVFLPFLWGGPAVDLFFILSGFILNYVYLSKDKPINWRKYVVARVARIAPLYYITLLIYPHQLGIFIKVLFGFPKYAVWFGFKFISIILLNLLMLAGLSGFHRVVNPPSWSISVELVLYATMFPLLVRFGQKLHHWMIGTIFGVSLLGLYCCHGHFIPQFIFNWPWTFLGRGIFGFIIGFFICSVIRNNLLSEAIRSGLTRSLLLYGLTPLVYVCSINGILPDGSIVFIFPILVFYTALNEHAYGGVLASNALQWLGDRSYSIYLWHYPILAYYKKLPKEFIELKYPLSAVINCSLMILVVLIVSGVSYKYFEIPCREFIRKLGAKNLSRSKYRALGVDQ